MPHRHSLTAKFYLAVGCLLAWLSFALADIQCAQPNSGTFKAGDPITLSWTSSGTPKVSDVTSMSGALYCDSGVKIADIPITNWQQAMTWTVPSVGNATTPGGTVGSCPANSFHVEYSGKYKVFLFEQSWGPVRCTSLTILPDPGIVPTTTTVAPTKTSTRSSTGTSSPTETESSDSKGGSGISSSVIIIMAIIAALVLFLVLFGTWWHLRKKRIERMENAVMPWSGQPSNPFSKVPSMEGDRNEMDGSAKFQPKSPEPTHGHYQDNGYGYGQHGAGGYGYNGYDNGQDDYYNPHYAQNMHGAHQGYAAHPGGASPSYYNGNRTAHQDPYQKQGYFPPPPPVSSPPTPSAPPSSAGIAHSNLSSTNLTTSSSLRRSPQVILPEKGSPYDDDGGQQIPMKDLSSRS